MSAPAIPASGDYWLRDVRIPGTPAERLDRVDLRIEGGRIAAVAPLGHQRGLRQIDHRHGRARAVIGQRGPGKPDQQDGAKPSHRAAMKAARRSSPSAISAAPAA